MNGLVYLNGAIIPARDAKISPFDRGFLFGDGLFETMRVYARTPYLLDRHLERMARGARAISLALPDAVELEHAVRATIDANDLHDGVVRLTASRGQIGDLSPDPDAVPTIFVNVRPLPAALESDAARHLVTLETRHVASATDTVVKSLSYLPSVLGMIELARRGAVEGIMLTREGFVAEGTVSNIFCVIEGRLWTPPSELGILPGITRARVLEIAEGEKIEIVEATFGLDRLLAADECFYTSSVREIVPVSSIDGNSIGEGDVGEVTRRLTEIYRRDVREQCGPVKYKTG
jgi:D-amino acid aminotransferase